MSWTKSAEKLMDSIDPVTDADSDPQPPMNRGLLRVMRAGVGISGVSTAASILIPGALATPLGLTWAGLSAVSAIGFIGMVFQMEQDTSRDDSQGTDDDTVVTRSDRWNLLRGRLGAVSEALANFETDPEMFYFSHRLLRDVNEPATQKFYDAYYAACALNIDTVSDEDGVVNFAEHVERAERTWDAASANALRKSRQNVVGGNIKLTSAQIADVETARRLLTVALNPAASPHEASLAWDKAQKLIVSLGAAASDDETRKLRVSALVSRSPKGITA
jgi:hypothetical protein